MYRSLLETLTFVSGFNSSIQHPLLYKHPIRHDDTIMLALGILSGQYIQTLPDGTTRVLSVEETQFIQGMCMRIYLLVSYYIHENALLISNSSNFFPLPILIKVLFVSDNLFWVDN